MSDCGIRIFIKQRSLRQHMNQKHNQQLSQYQSNNILDKQNTQSYEITLDNSSQIGKLNNNSFISNIKKDPSIIQTIQYNKVKNIIFKDQIDEKIFLTNITKSMRELHNRIQRKCKQLDSRLIEEYQYCNKIYQKNVTKSYFNNNKDKTTVAMWLAQRGIIPPKQWIHKSDLQDIYGNTVAILLAKNGIIPPKIWEHNPKLKNNKGETVGMLLSNNQITPPQQWIYIKDNSDCESFSVQNTFQQNLFLNNTEQYNIQAGQCSNEVFQQAYHGIVPQTQFQNPYLQDEDGQTVAMILAQKGIIPPQQCYHNPQLSDNQGITVAMYLAKNDIIPPHQWNHNPEYQDQYQYTVAMYLAENGIIPTQQWEHDSMMQSNKQETVFDILIKHKILPPKQWYHPCPYHGKNACTLSLKLAEHGILPPNDLLHDPYLENRDGFTVSFILASQRIVPPQVWAHNKYKRITYKQFKQLLLSQYKNEQTVQQFLALNIFRNFFNVDESEQYYYNLNFSIKNILDMQSVTVPDFWNYETEDFYDNTKAMLQASKGKIPDQDDQHAPEITNIYNQTVAMILAEHGIIPPREWYHDPYLGDNKGNTVAMILAYKGIVAPQEWSHISPLKNNEGETVAMILAKQGYNIPDIWYHNPYIQNKQHQTVYDILQNQQQNQQTSQLIEGSFSFNGQQQNKDIWQIKQQNTYPYIFGKEYVQMIQEQDNQQRKGSQSLYTISPQQSSSSNISEIKVNSLQKCNMQTNEQNKQQTNPQQEQIILHPLQQLISATTIDSFQSFLDQISLPYTPAMCCALEGKLPTDDMLHDPELRGGPDNLTVAEILSEQGIQPPLNWFYQDQESQKVAENLAIHQQIPQSFWIIDPYRNNFNGVGSSLKFILGLQGYILIDNKFFAPSCKTQIKNETCSICLSSGQKKFVSTICGHNICLGCFRNLVLSKNFLSCPICRKVFWYYFESKHIEKMVMQDFRVIGADLVCIIDQKRRNSILFSSSAESTGI